MPTDNHPTCYDAECDGSAHQDALEGLSVKTYKQQLVYELDRQAKLIADQILAWEDNRAAEEAWDHRGHSNIEVPY